MSIPLILLLLCVRFDNKAFLFLLSFSLFAVGHHLLRKQMFFLPFISRERQMDGESEESSAAQQGKCVNAQ